MPLSSALLAVSLTAAMPAHAPKSQVGATVRLTRDPHEMENPHPSFLDQQPLVERFRSFLAAGFGGAGRREIEAYVGAREAQWAEPITQLRLDDKAIRDPLVFRAQKAAALERFGRRPSEVTEGFVEVGETRIDGAAEGDAAIEIPARRIFYQRWKPAAGVKPSGRVVVISPGFEETGRNFYEQIQELNAQGDEAIAMDHQWNGYTSPQNAGGVDRGYGVARDLAAIGAFAQRVAQATYGARGQVVLTGNSMGAGAGVLGALSLGDRLHLALRGSAEGVGLEGAQLPANLPAVVQAPFLAATKSFWNRVIQGLGHLPLVRDLPLPPSGLPIITAQPLIKAKNAKHQALEHTTGQASAIDNPMRDLAEVAANAGQLTSQVIAIQSKRDTLASFAATQAFAAKAKDHMQIWEVDGPEHVLEENPATRGLLAQAVAHLAPARGGSRSRDG